METGYDKDRLRDRADEKLRRYRSVFEGPIIVAVWDFTRWQFREDSAVDAWLGSVAVRFHTGQDNSEPPPPQPFRQANGIITRIVPDTGEFANRDLSAVLLFRMACPPQGYQFECRVLHDPFSVRPIGPQPFATLRQLVPVHVTADSASMEWSEVPAVWNACYPTD